MNAPVRVLKLLTVLKQICNHPAQYLKEHSLKEHSLRQSTPLRGRSGKLDLLDELLDTITAQGESALVFTQCKQMAALLEKHLAERGVPSLFLHGATPVARREEMVDRFQRGEVPVFLLSLKAAGTGLNLTRASHVVHYDRWWNPAVEDQATDRAYRIGQCRDRLGGRRPVAKQLRFLGSVKWLENSAFDSHDLAALRCRSAPSTTRPT